MDEGSILKTEGKWRPDGEEAGSPVSSGGPAFALIPSAVCASAPDVRLAGDFVHFNKRFRITFLVPAKRRKSISSPQKKKKNRKEVWVKRGEAGEEI